MRTTRCDGCGTSISLMGDECVVEVDERSAERMRALLVGELDSPRCVACGKVTACTPTIIVWTDRRSRVHLLEGGPWSDGRQATDVWPQLAAVAIMEHNSLASLRATIDARCVERLELLIEAMEQCGREQGQTWFDEHYEALGPDLYVAELLGRNGVLSARIDLASSDADHLVGMVQSRACLAMCARWGNDSFEGRRLQDCIDAIVFQDAVHPTVPAQFATIVERMLSEKDSQPLRIALEATHAWLCACSGAENSRAESYTQAMFDLEILATEAGGSLPLLAHACRLDSERLARTLATAALEAAVAAQRGASQAGLVETARRLGHPEVAKHLITYPVPEWLSALKSPNTIGTVVTIGPGDKIIHISELTADGVLNDTNLVTEDKSEPGSEVQHDVFISYSSRDRVKADVLARYLQGFGLTVFMDHHTAAGDRWTRTIPRQLSTCRLVLVLWSRDSIQSPWVLKEAELASARDVLIQALLAPIEIPNQFAHVQSARLEAWSNEAEHLELERLLRDICTRLGREAPTSVPSTVGDSARQFERAEVAEAVFDLCNAHAWHAIAPASEQSLTGVARAYQRLKAALAPATDEVVHALLERFDPARVLLLAAIVGIDSLPPPFKVTRHSGATAVDCTSAQVSRAPFLDALRTVSRGEPSTSARLAGAGSDVITMSNGVAVEVSQHPDHASLIGRVTVRSALST